MALYDQDHTQAGGTTYHYHLDHLGTPRELTDSDGKLVWSARYRAYGNLALTDVEAIDNPLRFQGQYYDQETGLHYNLNRYYDPNAGRFIHQDPIVMVSDYSSPNNMAKRTVWKHNSGVSLKLRDAIAMPAGQYYFGRPRVYGRMHLFMF